MLHKLFSYQRISLWVYRSFGDFLSSLSARCNRYRATKELVDARAKIESLESVVADLERDVFSKDHEIEELKSKLQIQEIEIEGLSLVNERDRQRVRQEIEVSRLAVPGGTDVNGSNASD